MNRKSAGLGFTLLECLIALLVVGLVMGGSLFQVSRYAQERANLTDRLQAHGVAWNKLMDQYQLVQGWVPPNAGLAQANGTSEEGGRVWYWELNATSTLADDFYRYEIRVFDTDMETAETPNELAALLVAYFIAEQ